MDVEAYRDGLSRIVRGRPWIVAGGPAAAMTSLAEALLELGAERCLVIGSSVGTGTLPDRDETPWVDLGIEASDALDSVRRFAAAVERLPADVLETVERFDPDRRALVFATPFTAATEIAGRPILGPRPPAWHALEDKVIIDALWDEAGVARAPSAVVPVQREALLEASQRLDRGDGVVWQGDAREGFNGGGVYLRWLRDGDGVDEAETFFGAHCDRVRVTPFLEGIPCSIHGIAIGDEVAVFRPVELLNLREAGLRGFHYAGVATYWDPPDADRAAMRAVARTVGRTLRRRVGYRGAFGIDGILTADGFLPTELNSRYTVGHGVQSRSCEGLPLVLVHAAVVEGVEAD